MILNRLKLKRAVTFIKRIATISHKIFKSNFSFLMKQRTMGKVQFLFFRNFPLALTKFLFREKDWA